MPDYQELYNSLARVVESMQNRITMLETDLRLCDVKEKQWMQERENQQQIFQQMLTVKNAEHNHILEENQRLRERLEQLSSGL